MASGTITVNGSSHQQFIDGFGFNLNGGSWNNGAIKPWLYEAVNTIGARKWGIYLEESDWEDTNDDSNASNFNWTVYDTIFSAAGKFSDTWNTIEYLNSIGIGADGITLLQAGKTCDRLGGAAGLNKSLKDEFVEQAIAPLVWATTRRSPTLQIGYLGFTNETDWDTFEGVLMGSSDSADGSATYADVADRVATRLTALGMSTKLRVPDCATPDHSATYIGDLANKAGVMSRVDWLSIHSYDGTTSPVPTAAANAGKRWGLGELGSPDQMFSALTDGASACMHFEYVDGVYNHALRRGDSGTTPPNDELPGLPSPVSFNGSVYGKRSEFAEYAQLMRFAKPGCTRVSTSTTGTLDVHSFVNTSDGYVTIVGKNTGVSSVAISGQLNNTPGTTKLYYFLTDSTRNFVQQSDISVSSGAFSVTVPASSTFTFTSINPGKRGGSVLFHWAQ